MSPPSITPRLRRSPARLLLVFVVMVAVAVSGLLVAVPARPASAAALIWSDEFNGAAGSPPNGSRWGHDVGGGGWGNAQLEYDTNSTANAAHDGAGHLVLTALRGSGGHNCWYGPCQYTSARLNTAGRFTVRYGRLESRIKIPCGQGLWPAFWALGNNIGSVGWPASGEIDVMENVGWEPFTIHGSLHGPGYSGGNSLSGWHNLSNWYCDTFHTYAADWSSSRISFSVDGHVYASFTPASTRGNPWVFDHDFFLLLNLAVGGHWPGSPNDSTPFPARMLVDYVRVYSL
jgi:beta-glucanase (GH16 family)